MESKMNRGGSSEVTSNESDVSKHLLLVEKLFLFHAELFFLRKILRSIVLSLLLRLLLLERNLLELLLTSIKKQTLESLKERINNELITTIKLT